MSNRDFRTLMLLMVLTAIGEMVLLAAELLAMHG